MRTDPTGPTAGAGASSQQDTPAPAGARGTPAGGALARLVGPDVDAFAGQFWGAAPLLRTAADHTGFRDLLDLDGVDELLSVRGLRTPFLRLARHGSVVGSADFTGPGGVGAEIADQVRDDRVAALFADGTTVVLQALHRTWPAVIGFCTALAEDLGHPVQANAYVTPPQSQGFSAHYDVHDVFVLQLAGQKHWRVHEPVHTAPLRSQPWSDHRDAVDARARDDDPVVDRVLEPGDVMYLPRGWLHSATALGGVSAHLTIGVHVVTRYALVESLMRLVGSDDRLRASLPLGIDLADPRRLAPHLDAVRDALTAAVAAVPVARGVRAHVWSGGRPEPVGPVALATFAQDLAPGDSGRRRLGVHHRLVPGDDRVVLELAEKTLTLPAAVEPALRTLLAGGVHAVGELPGLDADDQVVLVRRLVREGVLVPAVA
ncbi:JmjC domain-containing protein [Pseudonocardia sp. ICBG1293]|uniref:cupin domain-containing protein n=1 Tax=Pseudonocardia sp. ICBG1293 TaxID=2844382 RepID=UPI001CCF93A1|nr:cupin domain-containing protein [Pseudonocardia sp. ICBG1293]